MVPVSLQGVTKRFGHTTAVDDITLQIQAGELFFLLGPSGCGKTTLLRMIAGLIEPSGGGIRFGDREVTRMPTRLRNAAMVFQGYALWPHMTVAENVAFGLDIRKVPSDEKKRRVDAALAMVQMGALANRRPAALSGGQQQRVALARALVVKPDVLLLDEPLSNLDAKLRQDMRTEIRRICHEANITAIYVTHDQEEALSMADRIALMKDGRLSQVGRPRELYEKPTSRFVAGFLGQTNFVEGKVEPDRNGAWRIVTAHGSMFVDAVRDDLFSGQNVTCSIRPESMKILKAGDEARNVVFGKPVRSVYLGPVAQHVFELAGGQHVQVNEMSPQGLPSDNEEMRIGFEAKDIVVIDS
ncbi:MAG: ABC transporter ATP-binding protein [Planctomycetota bacterium]